MYNIGPNMKLTPIEGDQIKTDNGSKSNDVTVAVVSLLVIAMNFQMWVNALLTPDTSDYYPYRLQAAIFLSAISVPIWVAYLLVIYLKSEEPKEE